MAINAYAFQHFGATPRVRIIGRVRCTEPGFAYWAAKCVITSPTAFWWERGQVIWQRPGTLYAKRLASRRTGAYTYTGGVSMADVPELDEAMA
jgi:hypothetical protein